MAAIHLYAFLRIVVQFYRSRIRNPETTLCSNTDLYIFIYLIFCHRKALVFIGQIRCDSERVRT